MDTLEIIKDRVIKNNNKALRKTPQQHAQKCENCAHAGKNCAYKYGNCVTGLYRRKGG